MSFIPNSVKAFIESNSFLILVKNYSVILNNLNDSQIKDLSTIALEEAFPRILLRLSLTRDTSNRLIFGGISSVRSHDVITREVSLLFEIPPFDSGLKRILAALSASTLIKSLPLNSDIKLFDQAKDIEAKALEELTSLTGMISDSEVFNVEVLRDKLLQVNASGNTSLFFSYKVKEDDLPISLFKQIKSDSIGRYKEKVIQTENTLCLEKNKLYYIHLFLTTNKIRSGQDVFYVLPNNITLEFLVDLLTKLINQSLIEIKSNLLASLTINKSLTKEVLYKDPLTGKECLIDVNAPIHEIEIKSRTLSPVIDRELIYLSLYSIDRDYIEPKNLSTQLKEKKLLADNFIDNLLYGKVNDYNLLNSFGPQSLFIDVEKGTLVDLEEVPVLSQSDQLDNSRKRETLIENIDTFHFNYSSGFQIIDPGKIDIRVSTVGVEEVSTWEIIIPYSITIPQLVSLINESLFQRQEDNKVLGSIPNPYALRIIPFIQTEYELKNIVEILNIPRGLSISIGNILEPLTPYIEGDRSITVNAKVDYILNNKLINSISTGENKEDTNLSSLVNTVTKELSAPLLKARNRLNRFNNYKSHGY